MKKTYGYQFITTHLFLVYSDNSYLLIFIFLELSALRSEFSNIWISNREIAIDLMCSVLLGFLRGLNLSYSLFYKCL